MPAGTVQAWKVEATGGQVPVTYWVEQAAQKVSPADFRDPVYRAIYQALLDLHAEGGRDAGGEWLLRVRTV